MRLPSIATRPRVHARGAVISKAGRQSEDELSRIKSRLDVNTAKSLLKAWKAERSGDKTEADDMDARELKRLVKERGARQSTLLARQLGIDAISASISWFSAITLASSRSEIAAQFLLFTLAIYQSSNALLDLTQLVQVGLLTRKYAAESEVILRAVEELIEESGISIVDKLRAAIDTQKVLQQLDEVLELLKADLFAIRNVQGEDDFLRDLGAYLVLVNAYSKKDGSWMKGIDSNTLFQVAGEFALVDSNDDGFIDAAEFKRLIRRVGRDVRMSDLEIDVAMEQLDVNGDKVIDFEEFVNWVAAKEEL